MNQERKDQHLGDHQHTHGDPYWRTGDGTLGTSIPTLRNGATSLETDLDALGSGDTPPKVCARQLAINARIPVNTA
ncbi:unnamed protein product [Caretta caretta]